jgi:hypothetical protein
LAPGEPPKQVPRFERRPAGSELTQDQTERPDVGLNADLLGPHQLLRRHVARRAEHHAGFVPTAELCRDPKIDDLDACRPVDPSRQEQIRWFEIPVDDAERVRFGQCFAALQDEQQDVLEAQRAARAQQRSQIGSVQQLEAEIGVSARADSDVVDAHGMFALQAGGRASFPHEELLRSATTRSRQAFQRHFPAEDGVGCEPHDRHASPPEGMPDQVAMVPELPLAGGHPIGFVRTG